MKAIKLKILDPRAEHPVVEVDGKEVLLDAQEIVQRRLTLASAFLADDRVIVALFEEDDEMAALIRNEKHKDEGRWLEFFGVCANYEDNLSGFGLDGARLWKHRSRRYEGNPADPVLGKYVGKVTERFIGLNIDSEVGFVVQTGSFLYCFKNLDTGEIERAGCIK